MMMTSSLRTSWGRDLANSARVSDALMYSAAHDSSSLRIDEPSGVSSQTWMSSGVAGMCFVMRLQSNMAAKALSQRPSISNMWPSFQTPMSTSYEGVSPDVETTWPV